MKYDDERILMDQPTHSGRPARRVAETDDADVENPEGTTAETRAEADDAEDDSNAPSSDPTPRPEAGEEVDEDGIVVRNSSTVDVEPGRIGISRGEIVEGWKGEYEEIPAPTYEELALQGQAAMRLNPNVNSPETYDPSKPGERGAESRGPGDVLAEGHDYDASVERTVPHLGLINPTYD